MALDTFANLKISIENWSSRGDINSLLDDFISLTEAEMYAGVNGGKGLRLRSMETSAAITVSGRVGTLPAGYIESRSVIHVTGGRSTRIDYVAPQSQRIATGSGVPSNFTVRDNVEFNTTVSGTVTLEYYTKLTGLSSSNTSNGILSSSPNIYLFGALSQVFKYAQDSEEETKYRGLFEAAILGANKQDRDGRYQAPAGRVRGATP